MPVYRVPGIGMVHIKLSGKAKKYPPAPCCAPVSASTLIPNRPVEGVTVRCMAISTILCDWPVDGGTCDAPLCAEHATEVGLDRHLCPIHFAQHVATQPIANVRQHDSASGFVDCGECPNVSSGCRSGRCLKARTSP